MGADRFLLLPEDLRLRIVGMAFSAGPPLLGARRVYGVVGTRILIGDERWYRRDNVPPTLAVKRALVAIWRSGMATEGFVEFRLLTMGTGHVVRYRCSLRGFQEGPAPGRISDFDIESG